MPSLSQKSDDAWTFRCYAAKGQGGSFDGWYASRTPEVQAEIDAALEILAKARKWELPYFDNLHGACEGLGEIRIDVTRESASGEKRECYRILGFNGPERRDFTLLCGFLKVTGSEYSRECRKAHRRKDGVTKDGRRASICEFP